MPADHNIPNSCPASAKSGKNQQTIHIGQTGYVNHSSRVICVTQRNLCRRPFLEQLRTIAKARPLKIILREKDMNERDYLDLLIQCRDICQNYKVPLFAHTFIQAARAAQICSIHLPLPVLEANAGLLSDFQAVGTSVHSLDEARRAAALGANYMTAGHIFNTQCKAGLPGRGLDFLSLICKESPVPVFAIGGITPENMPDILKAGAAGGCMMSSLMTAENPESLISP